MLLLSCFVRNCSHECVQLVSCTYHVHYNDHGCGDVLVFFGDKAFERYNVKRFAVRHSPCGIAKVVGEICPFVLFFTCRVTYFRRIIIIPNSSALRNTDKSLHKCSLLMVSNAFVMSSKCGLSSHKMLLLFHIVFSLQQHALKCFFLLCILLEAKVSLNHFSTFLSDILSHSGRLIELK